MNEFVKDGLRVIPVVANLSFSGGDTLVTFERKISE